MRKVLSFVLVLALVLSSFSMAFAGSSTELTTLSDIDGNANEEAIGVVYDLGIVTGNPDGTFTPAKAVTRAEFAAMLTRALAIPDSALAAYATSSFKDTSGYAWAVPYLAFCNSKGIMLGDGAGNAMPGNTINANEAVTMTLRALGYTANSAELVGVWPSNYVTKAQELELYDDVANTTGVDKANAAQIIYNVLTVQKVSVNSDGDTDKLWDDEPDSANGYIGEETTLLSAGLNCDSEKGVVGNGIDIDDSLINIAKNIGKYGTVYTNDDDEIVAFISDCDTLVGRFTYDGSSTYEFNTTDAEEEYNIAKNSVTFGGISVDNAESFAHADVTVGAIAASTIGASTYGVGSDEYVINVDLSGKTIKKIYSAVAWSVDNADQVTASDIADITDDQSLLGQDFYLDDNDEIDYTQFQLVGVSSLSDIKADNVVYVYADTDGIRKVEVGTQTATGIIKSFKDAKDDNATKFAIGATTYKNAEEIINGSISGSSSVVENDVTDEVTAFLDGRGYVYDFEDSTSATNFAVVEDLDSGINDEVKLMLADGTEKVYTYDDDEDACGQISEGAVIGYGLDSSSEVSDSNKNYVATSKINLSSKKTIKTITSAKWTTGSNIIVSTGAVEVDRPTTLDADQTYTTVSAWTDIDNASISSDCVVFTRDSGGDYDVTTLDKVETDLDITGAVLLFDEENDGSADLDTVVAMIIPEEAAGSGDDSYAVFNDADKTSNDDGDKVWELTGYLDGVKITDVLTDDDDASISSPDYNNLITSATVELYQVTVDASGVVTDVKSFASAMASDSKLAKQTLTNIGSADDRSSVVSSTGTRYALSDTVVVYRLTKDDEYTLYTGDFEKYDDVILYETNDDNDGYDVVILVK